MINLDVLRSAMVDEAPWSRLDKIVRDEMAMGRTVQDIADEFRSLANAVWELKDVPEDGQDAFGDTLDALTGNCHSSSCYLDPASVGVSILPTENILLQQTGDVS